MATATAPTSLVGKLMVVSGGATMAAMGTSSNPTTLTSSGTEIPRLVRPAMTPSAIWSLKARTADTPLATIWCDDGRRRLERRFGHGELHDLHPRRTGWCAGRRVRRSPAAHDPLGPPRYASFACPSDGQVLQRVGDGRCRPQQDGRVLAHRAVDEDRRRGSQTRPARGAGAAATRR